MKTTATARWVLVSSVLASSMVFIDGTALSIALPALQADTGAGGADLLWVTNGFSLPLAALLLLGGGLGDAFGRRRVFVAGILAFILASVACGLAPGVHALIAARVAQGVGGALMIPGALAMISTYFGPAERGRAIGTWSACSVLATAAGPVLGGLLARAGLWRWVFFINVPLAIFALLVLLRKTPADQPASPAPRVDWWGAITVTLGLAALTHGLIQGSKPGHNGFLTWGAVVLGVLALLAFLRLQQVSPHPLLPLGMFRSVPLTAASGVSLLFFMAFHGMLFFLPLNLIQVQHYDPALAGLSQLPLMALLILLSRFAGRFVDRHGPRLPLTLGSLVTGAGFWLLTWPGITRGPADFAGSFLPGLLLVGAGLGLTATPLNTAVIGAVPPGQLGLASGINSTLTRLAGVLAIALLGPVALVSFERSLEARTARLNLPVEARLLLKQEAVKMADAQPPSKLRPADQADVKTSIQLAFVDAFRRVAQLAAGLCGLAALVAFRYLKSVPTALGAPPLASATH